jgi:hypothetical protein
MQYCLCKHAYNKYHLILPCRYGYHVNVTNTTSVDTRDDLLHEELDVCTTGNKNDTL